MLKLTKFKSNDYKNLVNWINNEKDLFQFAGNIFEYPVTKNQIENYLNDSNRLAFKVEFNNQIIGHSEIYLENKTKAKLCRIIIGRTDLRGKGIGKMLTNELLRKSFEELDVETVNLNVFDWNLEAIKCYEKCGLKINESKIKSTQYQNEIWKTLNMEINNSEWLECSKI